MTKRTCCGVAAAAGVTLDGRVGEAGTANTVPVVEAGVGEAVATSVGGTVGEGSGVAGTITTADGVAGGVSAVGAAVAEGPLAAGTPSEDGSPSSSRSSITVATAVPMVTIAVAASAHINRTSSGR